MLDADHRRFLDRRMRHDLVLELDRAHPFAARLDDILGAVDERYVALVADDRDVARAQPAVFGEGLCGALVVIVGTGDPGPADLQFASTRTVPRQTAQRPLLDDAELDGKGHEAD